MLGHTRMAAELKTAMYYSNIKAEVGTFLPLLIDFYISGLKKFLCLSRTRKLSWVEMALWYLVFPSSMQTPESVEWQKG